MQAEENMLWELQEVAQLGAKAKVHRLCVQLTRNERGVKGRRYTHVALACQLFFFFAIQSHSTGVLGIFRLFYVRRRVHERFFFA